MVNFYHVSKPDGVGSHRLQSVFFRLACERRGVQYKRIIEGDRNPLDYHNLQAESSDLVYRSACGKWAKKMELHLLSSGCKSVSKGLISGVTRLGSSYHAMLRHHLPVIPSVEFIPRKKADVLAVSNYLGGFPMVVKVSGGMEGQGIIRVDSIEALNSILDYLRGDTSAEIRLMKYINHDYYARVVVVSDKVIAATKDTAPTGDFRTNARGPRQCPASAMVVPDFVAEIAVLAVQSVGAMVGGVDILFSDNGDVYITEVNRPFNFAETQVITGVDIAGNIIDSLQMSI